MSRPGKRRRLHPEALHFFDTNFLIHAVDLPIPKNVPLGSRWITETVRREAIDHLGVALENDIDERFRSLAFRDLYAEDQRVCPVFYWFVLSMYNPATVGSANFLDDWFESRLIKKTATPDDRKVFERFRRHAGAEAARQASAAPAFGRLKHMSARLDKKARRSLVDKHPAYIRDIKSLSLALYRCLSSRQNVVYHTADGDLAILLIKWVDSITTWVTVLNSVLPKLGSLDKSLIVRGGKVTFEFEFADFARRKETTFRSMLNDRDKTNACRFTVKHWNRQDHRSDESVYLVFEDEIAGWLSNLHGPMFCRGAPNAELGNWLRVRYHWPPDVAHPEQLPVEVYGKAVVRHPPIPIATSEHDRECSYRQDDVDGKIQDWSQFL